MTHGKPFAAVALKIYGRVQGVCYRANAVDKAQELDLVGWVRNRSDDTVEAEAQGVLENLKDFIEWCKKGPPAAKVTKVDQQWRDIEKLEYSGFHVERSI
eukprot:jgi/Galph1/1712/GphlegSOOS_G383.1